MSQEPVILDARGKSLGRVASEAAGILRGKTNVNFEFHTLPEERVVITNASRIRVTGSKMKDEKHERYSGYPGGLKEIPYERSFKKDPAKFVANSVAGMIPRNRLKKEILKHLTVYANNQE
ncbi:MAG: 50S ribosomal protein L13 [bacterium]|nr:50S ribosomal protein L13 [bacterium]